MAQPAMRVPTEAMPLWKTVSAGVCAVLLGLVFLVAGVWKVTDPLAAATRMAQALVPPGLSLAAALAFGIVETFAGALIIVPRFRRWGAWLTGLLLAAFVVYIGINYQALRGEECNCFPWVKRAVGPAFFIGDFLMLAMAAIAGWWGRPSHGLRTAALILAAVVVFAGVSYGVVQARQTGTKAPEFITVNGAPYSLQHGRVFIHFFDPECAHCDRAARELAKLRWRDVRIVSVATRMPQFGEEFLRAAGFPGPLSPDAEILRKTFPFTGTPFAVALVDGRQQAAMPMFDDKEPAATLRKLGFIE